MVIKVKCPLCEEEFTNVHSLFSHMLILHCDEHGNFIKGESKALEIYRCTICGFSTSDANEFIKHMKEKHPEELKKALVEEGRIDLLKELFPEETIDISAYEKEVSQKKQRKRRKRKKEEEETK